MSKYSIPKSIKYNEIQNLQGDEKERGLDGFCEVNDVHNWLLLPLEEGQKQYLICLHCLERSHL